MYTAILQDWLSVSLAASGAGVLLTQSAAGYIDAQPFADAIFYVDIAAQTGGATLLLQTSPTQDDAMFVTMASTVLAAPSGINTVTLNVLLAQLPFVPLGRWVRWNLQSGTTANPTATFRITATFGTGQ